MLSSGKPTVVPLKTKKSRRAPKKVMTWAKIKAAINAGHGQGHGGAYRPWLEVTRATSSPVSNTGIHHSRDFKRGYHYLGASERSTIQALKWLGAIDIREQYPVWPWSHFHPGTGLPGTTWQRQPGLLEIAARMSIKHGDFVGTTIPYVATLDILSTWCDASKRYWLVAHECKPKDLYEALNRKGDRIRQRMELTGEYCKGAGIPRVIVHPEQWSKPFRANLHALEPLLSSNDQAKLRISADYRRFVEELDAHRTHLAPSDVIERLQKDHGLAPTQLLVMLHLALWHQDVDHDLDQPLELYRPLLSGGKAFKDKMHRSLYRRQL